MNVVEIQTALHTIGWPLKCDGVIGPVTIEAIRDFQHGYALGPDLAVDGRVGPKTEAALHDSIRQGGKCSPNFAYREFTSAGNGWIKVNRTLVRGLEEYRKHVGPVRIVSGYRDPAHNHEAGGASDSQHLYGSAADLDERLTLAQVKALRQFSGIGIQRSSGLVRHVDVRGRDGAPRTTPGTVDNPTTWFYG